VRADRLKKEAPPKRDFIPSARPRGSFLFVVAALLLVLVALLLFLLLLLLLVATAVLLVLLVLLILLSLLVLLVLLIALVLILVLLVGHLSFSKSRMRNAAVGAIVCTTRLTTRGSPCSSASTLVQCELKTLLEQSLEQFMRHRNMLMTTHTQPVTGHAPQTPR